MIPTSETYNPYTTIRDVNMEVRFDAIADGAAEYATYTSTDTAIVADLTQLNTTTYSDIKYATCENDLVMLDGTWDYLPDTLTTQHLGWWSESVSDDSGVFDTPPTLNIDVGQSVSCVGFTLYTSKTNPIKQCTVTTYRENSIIYSETFEQDTTDNPAKFIIDLPVENVDEIKIEVNETQQPYRRVKMPAFAFGITKIWDRNKIVKATVEEEADITGESLPINELTVEFDNSTGEFDLFGTTQKYIYRRATKSATVTASDLYSSISKVSQVTDENTTLYKYATCEDDLVMLDGTWDYLPDNTIPSTYQIGYLNNSISDENGEFETAPKITFTWGNFSSEGTVNISGIKIYFGEENYANSITVTAYAYGVVSSTETYENDAGSIEMPFSVEDTEKIEITFNSTAKPHRYIKVADIQFLKYADSWGQYLTKNQHLEVDFIINGERVSMGKSYLFDTLEQKNGGLTAEIVAKDYVSHMDVQKYTEGAHGNMYLRTALNGIWGDTNIPIEYSPSTLETVMVSKSAPEDTTKRAATHYFAQAAKATCFLSRDGKLKIKAFNISTPVDTLTPDNMYEKDVAKMNEYINMIRLTVNDEYTDPATENIYYGGSGLYYRELENDCVYASNGQAVANWLLDQFSRRVYFEAETRGNPAIELGDTIRILTSDGTIHLAVVYHQVFEYDGGLRATIEAVVGVDS